MLNKSELLALKGVNLHDQFKLFKDYGAPNLQKPFTKPTNVAGIWDVLSISIDMYLNKKWSPYATMIDKQEENNSRESDGSDETKDEVIYKDDWEDM